MQTDKPNNNAANSRWIDIPFSPRKWPFFYGWVVVAAATLGMICSIPGQTVGVGVFTDKLIEALGLSRTQISAAYMIGTVISSFLLPFTGTLTDRWGTRVIVVASSLGLGVSLSIMSRAQTFADQINHTILVFFMAAFFFLLIRFFGQGCLMLVSRITISKWFNHRRGLATGISSIFVTFFFNAAPAFLNKLVAAIGWQNAYLVLATLTGFGMAAIGWIFYRDNPEQCGLVMDGCDDPEWIAKVASRVPETSKDYTRKEAVRTLEFWIYTAVTAWQALLMTAVIFHITSIGAESDLNRTQSFSVFWYIGIASVAVVLIGGWLSDRIRLKWLLLVMILGQILTAAGLLDFTSPAGRIIFIGGYAFAGGLFGLLLTVTWPRYFGRKHLGSVSSLVMSIIVFASAVGPFLFSSLRDLTGTFHTVTILSITLPTLFIIPALKVQNPQNKLNKSL